MGQVTEPENIGLLEGRCTAENWRLFRLPYTRQVFSRVSWLPYGLGSLSKRGIDIKEQKEDVRA